jgi:hypothetical protein
VVIWEKKRFIHNSSCRPTSGVCQLIEDESLGLRPNSVEYARHDPGEENMPQKSLENDTFYTGVHLVFWYMLQRTK